MRPSTRLKLASLLFGIVWALVMFWWSGQYNLFNAVALAICGAGAGYGWFCLMLRYISRGRVPQR